MVAGADGDAGAVEHGAEVVRVDAVDEEGDHRRLARRGAEDAQPVDGLEPLGRPLQQRVLVRCAAAQVVGSLISSSSMNLTAAPSPTAPAMFGVPASKRWGGSA